VFGSPPVASALAGISSTLELYKSPAFKLKNNNYEQNYDIWCIAEYKMVYELDFHGR